MAQHVVAVCYGGGVSGTVPFELNCRSFLRIGICKARNFASVQQRVFQLCIVRAKCRRIIGVFCHSLHFGIYGAAPCPVRHAVSDNIIFAGSPDQKLRHSPFGGVCLVVADLTAAWVSIAPAAFAETICFGKALCDDLTNGLLICKREIGPAVIDVAPLQKLLIQAIRRIINGIRDHRFCGQPAQCAEDRGGYGGFQGVKMHFGDTGQLICRSVSGNL